VLFDLQLDFHLFLFGVFPLSYLQGDGLVWSKLDLLLERAISILHPLSRVSASSRRKAVASAKLRGYSSWTLFLLSFSEVGSEPGRESWGTIIGILNHLLNLTGRSFRAASLK
jgi:hypothetical protein